MSCGKDRVCAFAPRFGRAERRFPAKARPFWNVPPKRRPGRLVLVRARDVLSAVLSIVAQRRRCITRRVRHVNRVCAAREDLTGTGPLAIPMQAAPALGRFGSSPQALNGCRPATGAHP